VERVWCRKNDGDMAVAGVSQEQLSLCVVAGVSLEQGLCRQNNGGVAETTVLLLVPPEQAPEQRWYASRRSAAGAVLCSCGGRCTRATGPKKRRGSTWSSEAP
jgi:hypothetical protein